MPVIKILAAGRPVWTTWPITWASSTVEITETAKQNYPLLVEFLDLAEGATVRTDNLQATMYPNLLDVVSQDLPLLASGEMTPTEFCQTLSTEAAKNQ